MSWNVLADHYALQRYFPYATSQALRWEERRERIKRAVLCELPDLLVLQEVQSCPEDPDNDHAAWFGSWLQGRGYDVTYGRKQAAVNIYAGGQHSLLAPEWCTRELPGTQIGNMTAWRKGAFECEESRVVPLAVQVAAACPDQASVDFYTARHCQVLLLSTLRHVPTGKRLVVGNTHLVAPRSQLDHERKLVQMQQLAAGLECFHKEVEYQATLGPRPRAVLAGDFNAVPGSVLYDLLITGSVAANSMNKVEKEGLKQEQAEISRPRLAYTGPGEGRVQLQSAFTTMGGAEPLFTNYTEGFKGCLDYITYVPDGLRCSAVGELPPESALKEDVALPNAKQPSDHLPVLCRLEFE